MDRPARILVWSLLILWVALFVMALVEQAGAHEWYPWECCSDNDCAPIPMSESPREERGGFTLIDGRHFDYKTVRPSPDGKWHLCEQKFEPNPADRKILCVWGPVGGV